MSSYFRRIFKFLIDVDPHERIKVLLLSISFFFVIGAYTVAKELKDSIFISIVGLEYIPVAKMLSIIVLIPCVLFYSRLVDILRRYHLLYFYTIFFGLGSIFFAYFLGHPVIGINNTDTSPYRLYGWLFYFFVEGFSPFLVSIFWAFVNSITSPEAAKSNYTLIISGSKLGGIFTAFLAVMILGLKNSQGQMYFSDAVNHQILLLLVGVCLLIVPFFIALLIKKVPGRYLHGYEAAYQVEKQRDNESTGLRGMISGLVALFKYPYMLGIFGMLFFYEVINVVFGYERLGVGRAASANISQISGFLLDQVIWVHFVGLLIVLFGARTLVKLFGERICLLLIPLSTGILLAYFMINPSPTAVLIVFVAVRSINYAFANPLRESLYIPTTKDMKFKSRSWIDASGSKIAKGSGSLFNLMTAGLASAGGAVLNALFFAGIIGLWTLNAYWIGKRYDQAIKSNEVIGS